MSLALHGVAIIALYPVRAAPEAEPADLVYEMTFETLVPEPEKPADTAPPEQLASAAPPETPSPSEPSEPPPVPPPAETAADAAPAPEPAEPVQPAPQVPVAEPAEALPPPAARSQPVSPRPPAPPVRKPFPRIRKLPQEAASIGAPPPGTAVEQAQSPPASVPAPVATPPPSRPSAAWLAGVGAWLAAHRSYPDAARQGGQQGTVIVHFTVDRDGHVLDVTLVRGSGSDALDEAATALLRQARLPPFPPDMTLPHQSITVPIHYRLE